MKIKIKKPNINIEFYSFLAIFFALFFLSTLDSQAKCVYADGNYHVGDPAGEIITPIYRLFNADTGMHVYTRGVTETNKTLGKWIPFEYTDPTPTFCSDLSQKPGLTPIYRVYNKNTGAHVYTRGTKERDNTLSKWSQFVYTDPGPAFYASLTEQPGLTPIFRLYNTNTGGHIYVRGTTERDNTLSKWNIFKYTDPGPAFWAHITHDAGPTITEYQGPTISVGLHAYTRDSLRDTSFRVTANKRYVIKDKNGTIIARVDGDSRTKVKYDSGGNLRIYDSIAETLRHEEITFEAADGDNSTIIFDLYIAGNSIFDNYDEYRGKIKLRYIDNSASSYYRMIWVINELPLEHYTWGMGEITGTGPMEYNKLMTTVFRTYGYWKILYSTKYAKEGFKVDATPGNQIYRGYDWERTFPRIKQGALATRGKFVKYREDFALTPYSSWTDGRTRSFEERWGSDNYPWCQSVSDPYGKHPSKSTSQLVSEGNHMVGISAHGALSLADDHGWDWQKIIRYYLTGITIEQTY